MPALLEWGVRGFVPLHVSLDVLLPIVRILASGGSHLPATLFHEPQVPRRPESVNSCDRLTPRETEILRLLAHGAQNKNIAAELGLSQHTVKLHIHNIIRKMGVSNRTEAAARFFERLPSAASVERCANGTAIRRG